MNKGFIQMAFGEIFLRDTAGSAERARWLYLAHSGSQSQRVIWFILPAHGASHIIRVLFVVTFSHLSPWGVKRILKNYENP